MLRLLVKTWSLLFDYSLLAIPNNCWLILCSYFEFDLHLLQLIIESRIRFSHNPFEYNKIERFL